MSDLDTDFTVLSTPRDLPQNRPAAVVDFLDGADYHLVVSEDVLSGLRRQAGGSPDREIGGVLVGRHYCTDGRFLVHVEDYIAVPSDDSGVAHFAFDKSSIRAILDGLAKHPDTYVVGWYHSHVGGEPFMSDMDITLHSSHFSEPWYISCVVSLGTKGRPTGFWRMESNKLVEVADYAIAMSTGGEFAASQEVYLDACGLAAPSAIRMPFTSLVWLCGMPDDGSLSRALSESAAGSSSEEALVDARFVVRAVMTAAADPCVQPELDALSARLQQLISFDEAMMPVSAASVSGDRITLYDRECYSYSRHSITLKRVDLDLDIPLPVRVRSTPLCVAHGTDGYPWMLGRNADLICLPRVDMRRWLAGDHTFLVTSVELPEVDRPRQIVPLEHRMWLRTATSWHSFDLPASGGDQLVVESHRSGPLPTMTGVFVPANGFSDPEVPPRLMACDDGVLRLWTMTESGWTRSVSCALPEPWRGMRVSQAAQAGTGWYVLLADVDEIYLCLFDTYTLELVHHIVRRVGEKGITGISGNGSGLVYAKAGGVLFRA